MQFPGRIEQGTFELGAPRRLHATMGLPRGHSKNAPDVFLRRGSSLTTAKIQTKATTRAKTKTKAPVPAKDDRPVMGLFTEQNYVTKNAVDVILAKPKRAEEECLWTQRKGFGKVPKYLAKTQTNFTSFHNLPDHELSQQVRNFEVFKQTVDWQPRVS